MKTTCRSAYFTAPGTIEVRDEGIAPKPGESLFESELIGISHGTELLVYRNEFPRDIPMDASFASLGARFAYPVKYGYSNVGTANGRRVFSFAPHQNKFFATDQSVIEIPGSVSPEDAIFLPNLETALSAVHDARPRTGELAVVIGGGVVGQLICEILSRSFYGSLALVEPHPYRMGYAESRGITTFTPNQNELLDWVQSQSNGRGADVIIHASGCEDGLQLGIDLLGFSGRLVEASWYGAKHVSIGLGSAFHRKRLRIISCQVSTIPPEMSGLWDNMRRLDVAMSLLESIHPGYLISHTFPLDKISEAFALIDKHPGKVMQVVLDPCPQE